MSIFMIVFICCCVIWEQMVMKSQAFASHGASAYTRSVIATQANQFKNRFLTASRAARAAK